MLAQAKKLWNIIWIANTGQLIVLKRTNPAWWQLSMWKISFLRRWHCAIWLLIGVWHQLMSNNAPSKRKKMYEKIWVKPYALLLQNNCNVCLLLLHYFIFLSCCLGLVFSSGPVLSSSLCWVSNFGQFTIDRHSHILLCGMFCVRHWGSHRCDQHLFLLWCFRISALFFHKLFLTL